MTTSAGTSLPGARVSPKPLTEFTWPSDEVSSCPYPFYGRLRDEAPVYNYPPGSDLYLVSRWEDIVYIMEHPDLFLSDLTLSSTFAGFFATAIPHFPDYGGTKYSAIPAATTDPPQHKIKRRWLLKMAERERIPMYREVLTDLVDSLIDTFAEQGECEFRSQFAVPLAGSFMCDLIGLPRDDHKKLISWVDDAVRGFIGLSEEEQRRRDVANRALNDYALSAVMERHENPTDDLLSELIATQVEDDGQIDINYQVAQAANLIIAAGETTTHMLVNTLVLLLSNPESLQRVIADHTLVRAAIEESLRFETPFQWFCRVCKKDTVLGGVAIPAGSLIVIIFASGNRDPSKFDDPDTYDIDRPNVAKDHLAFGRGRHLCVGAPLARLEGEVAFTRLFTRLKNIRMVEERSDLANLAMKAMRGPKTLHVRFEQR